MKRFFGKVAVVSGAVGAAVMPSLSHAALGMPTLPITDLETAGTAVLGLVAVGTIIGVVIRLFKKA